MKIDKYEFGEIYIDGKKYNTDVIIFPDKVESNWWRKEGHSLCLEDLREVLGYKCDIIVIGTGMNNMMEVKDEVIKYFRRKNIEIVINTTTDACKTYNKLTEKGDKIVIACLHLTC
jgi:hypothetical protein